MALRSPLGHFSFGMSAISLTIILILLIVTQIAVFRDTWGGDDRPVSNATGLYLFGDLRPDLDAGTSSIFWTAVICDPQAKSTNRPISDDNNAPERCNPPTTALDVYITSPSKPDFSYVPSEPATGALVVWDHLTFATEHRIHKYDDTNPSTQPKISPGHYFFDTLAFVMDPATNQSVRIAMLAVGGAIEGFVVRSHEGPAKNVFASDTGDGLVNVEVESHMLRVEIKPSAIALANAISLFLVNWLATVGSIYVTILVTSGRLERNNVVAVGPFSALVGIPTVRSLYVNSPSLVSPVESAAFFVQIAAVVSCSVILLKVFTSHKTQ